MLREEFSSFTSFLSLLYFFLSINQSIRCFRAFSSISVCPIDFSHLPLLFLPLFACVFVQKSTFFCFFLAHSPRVFLFKKDRIFSCVVVVAFLLSSRFFSLFFQQILQSVYSQKATSLSSDFLFSLFRSYTEITVCLSIYLSSYLSLCLCLLIFLFLLFLSLFVSLGDLS